jgi:hypothetical protein
MPVSKKRKTKHGKSVRRAVSAAPVRPAADLLGLSLPPLRVAVRDLIDAPLWVGSYYRGILPARCVGGAYRHGVRVAIGSRPPQVLILGEARTAAAHAALLIDAARRGQTVTVTGSELWA